MNTLGGLLGNTAQKNVRIQSKSEIHLRSVKPVGRKFLNTRGGLRESGVIGNVVGRMCLQQSMREFVKSVESCIPLPTENNDSVDIFVVASDDELNEEIVDTVEKLSQWSISRMENSVPIFVLPGIEEPQNRFVLGAENYFGGESDIKMPENIVAALAFSRRVNERD